MLSENARKIADEAKSKGMWLYDPKYKMWQSPEQFKHSFTYANITDEYIKTLQIRDPREGVAAGFKKLNDLQSRLKHLTQAVFEYYGK